MDREPGVMRDNEPIKWSELSFVRAVVDLDKQMKIVDGKLLSTSVLNSSKGEIPRLTVHWALNHLVANHLYGDWSEADLIIISPGDKIVSENGVPDNLNAVDTFWSNDVLIPEGSVLLWFDSKPPAEFFELKGIENVLINTPSEIREPYIRSKLNYEKIKNDFDNKKNGVNIDDLFKAEDKYRSWLSEIYDIKDGVVNKELRKMGYEIFLGDHGTYMDGPMSEPIYKLAEAEKIHSTIHAYTFFGNLEEPTLSMASESDKELFKKEEDGSLVIDKIIRRTKYKIKQHIEFNKVFTQDEQTQLLIFATELYNRVRNNEQRLKLRTIVELQDLLSSSELIRKNWFEWDPELVTYIYKKII